MRASSVGIARQSPWVGYRLPLTATCEVVAHTDPMIAITPWRRTLATWAHPAEDLYTVSPDYLAGVERAGSHGAIVGHVETVDDAKLVLERFDGLILSGGEDVDPLLYGAANTDSIEPDVRADRSDIAYLEAARALDLPVLAVCRGLQIMNVAFGGTLHQHVWSDEGAHPPRSDTGVQRADADAFLANRHDVELTPGSRIADILRSTAVSVNSLHHQAADSIGDRLVVTGRASDSTVEVLEHPDGRIIGVQWHPEWLTDAGQPLFDWLVAAAQR